MHETPYLLAFGTFLLALPELVTSMKYIARKRFMPDLLGLAGFVILSLYTLTIVLTDAKVYPLFGFLFALIHLILALLSIVRKECPRGIRIAHCAILLGNLLGIIIPLFIFST